MKEVILITGANGNVAKELAKLLGNDYSIRFLTRNKKQENEFEWNIPEHTIDSEALHGVSYVIHLAGAGIAEKKLTAKRKKEILSSRIDSAKLILNAVKSKKIKLKAFISASGIGYYGAQTTKNIFTEEDNKGNDFLSDVCEEWERAADNFISENCAERVIKLRLGIVLSSYVNGPLLKIIQPLNYRLGILLGSGKQYMPWIHITDLCNIIKHIINHTTIQGTYNIAAPEQPMYKDFIKSAARIINKKQIYFNIPKLVLKAILGEITEPLTESSRVSINKLKTTGYSFIFPDLKSALYNLLKKN